MCDPCPNGMFAESEGASTCTQCELGHISNGIRCQKCPSGTGSKDGVVCSKCPPGTHSLENMGTIQCIPCAPGTASNINGTADVCPKCSVGTFSAKEGGKECIECPVGTRFVNEHSPCEECQIGNAKMNMLFVS